MNMLIVFTLIINSFCWTNGQNAVQPPNVKEFESVENDIIDYNLFRTKGDWVLRAVSDKSKYFTRVNFELLDDHVIFTSYINGQVRSSQLFRHLDDSKVVYSHPPSENEQTKYLMFHQCATVMIMVVVCPNNKKSLQVLVRTDAQPLTSDDKLRGLIQKVMARPHARAFIQPLLQTLEFVNQDIPVINYDAQEFPIHENDAVECDFSNAVGNWTQQANTDEAFLKYSHVNFQMTGNQVFIKFFDQQGSVPLTATMDYYRGHKVIHVQYYSGEGFQRAKVMLPFIDENSFIQISLSEPSFREMSVWSKSGKPFDKEYMKKVIDNQMLFSHDIKRTIKDLVPKLTFK